MQMTSSYLKLINAIAKAVASTLYYPTLHFQLVWYVAHVGHGGYELPWTVSCLVGVPLPAVLR